MAGGICAVYGCNNYHVKNSSKSFFSFPRDITRYPLYQKGNPQLRVFLPNFWMKLQRRPEDNKDPPNVVRFIVSPEMTKGDIENYLTKIYNIKVVNVRTFIRSGTLRQEALKGSIVKDDDEKIAIITLPREEKFEFPNIFPDKEKKLKDEKKSLDVTKKKHEAYLNKVGVNPGIPGWFSY